jgi:hypothetical protein
MRDALKALSGLHVEGTVRDPFAKYGLAPGCLCCGPGWPCESRALIDRILEETS